MPREIYRYHKRIIPSTGHENVDAYMSINHDLANLGVPIRMGPAILNGEGREKIDPHASAWYILESMRKPADLESRSNITLNQAFNKMPSRGRRRQRATSQT